jgi:hypothetical protein
MHVTALAFCELLLSEHRAETSNEIRESLMWEFIVMRLDDRATILKDFRLPWPWGKVNC